MWTNCETTFSIFNQNKKIKKNNHRRIENRSGIYQTKKNKMTNTQINEIEIEILNCIKLITLENYANGYSWHISNYKNSIFQKKLSIKAFIYLNNGLSKHGKFSCYGGSYGLPYMALNYKLKN
jgi:hypothetical protein